MLVTEQKRRREQSGMMGDTIRRYRREKGMTQEEVAAALGVTASAVHKWETGVSHS